MADDRVPLPFGGSDSGDMTFDQYKTRPPLQVTSGDAAQATFEEAQLNTGMGILARSTAVGNDTLNSVLKHTPYGEGANLTGSGVRDITPEEANTRYPDMETKWNKPVNPYVAQMMSDREQESRQLQATIEAGPQDFWSKAKYMGAGILAHAMDPIEFGAAALVGWGTGAVVSRTAWGAKQAFLAKAGLQTLGPRTAYHAIEAVGGNLIQTGALEGADAAVTHQEGQEVDPIKSMQNVAVNTFFGSVLHLGIKEASFQMSNKLSRFVAKNNPEADLMVARTAVGQAEQGIRPDVEPIFKAVAQETDVKGDYQYEPLTGVGKGSSDFNLSRQKFSDYNIEDYKQRVEHLNSRLADPNLDPAVKEAYETTLKSTQDKIDQISKNPDAHVIQGNFGDRKFYIASDPSDKFNPDATRHFGDVLGSDDSIKMTDNANVANAAANRALSDSPGKIFEVSAKDLNPINIDQPLPENAKAAFQSALEGIMKPEEIEKATPKEMLTKMWDAIDNADIPQEKITELQDKLKEQGYNAFLGDGSKVLGFDHSQHNDVTVFDKEVLKPTDQSWDSNPEIRNSPTPQEIADQTERIQDPKQKILVDPKAVDAFETRMQESQGSPLAKDNDLNYVDEQAQNYTDDLQQLDKQGLLDEQGKADLEALGQIDKNAELDRTLFKALETCLRA